MLESMVQGYNRQRTENQALKNQLNELIAQKHEHQNQNQQAEVVPSTLSCFRCDGRMTEKDRQDPCRRCMGTGRVNT